MFLHILYFLIFDWYDSELRSQNIPSLYPCIFLSILASSKRFAASEAYFSSNSIPKNLLDNFFDTTAVVPDPRKGSKIKSFFLLLAKIILANNFSGF